MSVLHRPFFYHRQQEGYECTPQTFFIIVSRKVMSVLHSGFLLALGVHVEASSLGSTCCLDRLCIGLHSSDKVIHFVGCSHAFQCNAPSAAVFMSVCEREWVRACQCARLKENMCVCMYAFVCVCVRACVCMCMCMHVCVYVLCVYVFMCMHTYVSFVSLCIYIKIICTYM